MREQVDPEVNFSASSHRHNFKLADGGQILKGKQIQNIHFVDFVRVIVVFIPLGHKLFQIKGIASDGLDQDFVAGEKMIIAVFYFSWLPLPTAGR